MIQIAATVADTSPHIAKMMLMKKPQNPGHAAQHNSRGVMTIHSPQRDPLLCRYPSKICDSMRSDKRGGGLHRFCAYHRDRANVNQRRVDHRRRLRRQGVSVPPLVRDQGSRSRLTRIAPTIIKEQVKEDHASFDGNDTDHNDDKASMPPPPPLLPDFTDEDLHELLQLLDETESVVKQENTQDGDGSGFFV